MCRYNTYVCIVIYHDLYIVSIQQRNDLIVIRYETFYLSMKLKIKLMALAMREIVQQSHANSECYRNNVPTC